jgi:hypothetical protein
MHIINLYYALPSYWNDVDGKMNRVCLKLFPIVGIVILIGDGVNRFYYSGNYKRRNRRIKWSYPVLVLQKKIVGKQLGLLGFSLKMWIGYPIWTKKKKNG